jgi:predicted MFS family arabinose efflux permease
LTDRAPASARQGDLRNYILVTAAYWADTVADGATRILVLFFFYQLGYSPFELATLFVFYEIFGLLTNLVGGYVAARLGLKATLFAGLGIQVGALAMLGLPSEAWLVVAWVMVSQALSGIAKDLTKMSSKSAVKLVVPEDSESSLFRWVAVLTGSKNALKGVGFFVGGLLLTLVGFQAAILILMAMVLITMVTTAILMHGGLGTVDAQARFRHMFSSSGAINVLAAARVFLFASRDVWFVVGLPVFLRSELGWSFWEVGTFLAIWVIGYGIVQASSPAFLDRRAAAGEGPPDGRAATRLAFLLSLLPALIATALVADFDPTVILVGGLILFGLVFAMNSAVHSYLVLSYSKAERVSMDVGFYYMANAGGRLAGTLLSGLVYQFWGLTGCLWVSSAFLLAAGLISLGLPRRPVASGPLRQTA